MGPLTVDTALRERYDAVRARIAAAARRSGRHPDEIALVAVTKSATHAQIAELVALGHRDLGENRVQSLLERAADLARTGVGESVRWHMIGTLQRNKVRRAVELCRLVHSVDNLRLAETLHEQALAQDRAVEILVQVNVSGESTKHGLNPRAAKAFVEQLGTMVNLEVRGLMCMAPLEADPERTRPVFERCRELLEDVRRAGAAGPQFNILSMGMSNDFEVAIECGANLVRVGSAIFQSA